MRFETHIVIGSRDNYKHISSQPLAVGRVGRIKWALRVLPQARIIIGLLGLPQCTQGPPGADYRIMGLDYSEIPSHFCLNPNSTLFEAVSCIVLQQHNECK